MIQVPGILTGFSTRLDGGASLRFSTQELSDNDVLELKRHQGQFGWLLFRENQFTPEETPSEDANDETKSPSQRLRAVLFVLWKGQGSKGDFEAYYRGAMEGIIDDLKAKID